MSERMPWQKESGEDYAPGEPRPPMKLTDKHLDRVAKIEAARIVKDVIRYNADHPRTRAALMYVEGLADKLMAEIRAFDFECELSQDGCAVVVEHKHALLDATYKRGYEDGILGSVALGGLPASATEDDLKDRGK